MVISVNLREFCVCEIRSIATGGKQTDQDSLSELQIWTTEWILKEVSEENFDKREVLGTQWARQRQRQWEKRGDREDNSRSYSFK